MQTNIYSIEGKNTGTTQLPEAVFGVSWNADLVHQVVVGMQANARAGTAHTKDRSEVRGGGKKPWRQKGTGRARHGSRRSPIWTGGGVTHGPRTETDHSVRLTKKMRAKALACVLSKKQADGEVVFVDALSLTEPKTAMVKDALASLAAAAEQPLLVTKRNNAAVVVLPERNEAVEKSFRNFGNVVVLQAKDVNPVDLLTYKFVLIVEPTATVEILSKRVASVSTTTKQK